MIITKYGIVVFREGKGPEITGWEIKREPEKDPVEATDNQLLLRFVINWARAKFELAVNSAIIKTLREREQKRLVEEAMTTKKERTDEIHSPVESQSVQCSDTPTNTEHPLGD